MSNAVEDFSEPVVGQLLSKNSRLNGPKPKLWDMPVSGCSPPADVQGCRRLHLLMRHPMDLTNDEGSIGSLDG